MTARARNDRTGAALAHARRPRAPAAGTGERELRRRDGAHLPRQAATRVLEVLEGKRPVYRVVTAQARRRYLAPQEPVGSSGEADRAPPGRWPQQSAAIDAARFPHGVG